ncbi:MAG: DUF2235 domain-containing protein [Marinosulfonomonas sp.]|nr:DUF2235 domain-containing protein [Marinosulfonomonas sp.]
MVRKLRLNEKIRRWLRLPPRIQTTTSPHKRGRVDHVVILDGTMSSLVPGQETNAGLAYKLICEAAHPAGVSIRYEQGVQWIKWRDTLDVIEGRGINRQICRSYGFIASRYRPGDRIFLLGYSRGAYAVRSLAGIIDRIGLLRAQEATERNIRQIYRLYQKDPNGQTASKFAAAHCHDVVPIEMVGVWDTVRALGIHWPLLWRFSRVLHEFHSAHLGDAVRHGFHALALDERRLVYAPVMWESRPDWDGVMEQMWFRGTHGDIGGQLSGIERARPLANIPLVWMMEKAQACGLALPDGWQDRFFQDVRVRSIGILRGWSLIFVRRRKRLVGVDPSEKIHPSAIGSFRLHDKAGR